MNLGLSTSLFCDIPLNEALPIISQAGFKTVEIWASPDSLCRYVHFDYRNPNEVENIKRQLFSLGIQPLSLHSPFYPSFDLSHIDRSIQQESVNATLAAAEVLKEIGGKVLVVHPSGIEMSRISSREEEKSRLDQIEKSIDLIYQSIEKWGLVLALETLLPSFLGSDLEFLFQLVSRYPQNVGICFDTGHVFLKHKEHFILRYKEIANRVVALHVQDTFGEHDDHLPPGEGIIRWKDFIESLKEKNFQSTFLLELSSQRLDKNNPRNFLSKLYEHGIELINGL
ncbi:sugar phosphate isomerase/epimerase family protein [Methylacidiphilum caldifontis]|uniref:Sugar phosphate isomerase n=1 Tax=Methylacidiphilum caldifontis TaxID=2795386 RepID=A0A4Y8PA64_9BACT|nr:sugar phosphate isomerase/epimerase family protein [Methylacidiphilum caldifontis]QSR89074.1 sugar phosphate isomerase/epimerase [Methylacidiphilum caldifontis]TFE67421.1 sugar phosphate isomerase [Methylacidiphilum caldifontis]